MILMFCCACQFLNRKICLHLFQTLAFLLTRILTLYLLPSPQDHQGRVPGIQEGTLFIEMNFYSKNLFSGMRVVKELSVIKITMYRRTGQLEEKFLMFLRNTWGKGLWKRDIQEADPRKQITNRKILIIMDWVPEFQHLLQQSKRKKA